MLFTLKKIDRVLSIIDPSNHHVIRVSPEVRYLMRSFNCETDNMVNSFSKEPTKNTKPIRYWDVDVSECKKCIQVKDTAGTTIVFDAGVINIALMIASVAKYVSADHRPGVIAIYEDRNSRGRVREATLDGLRMLNKRYQRLADDLTDLGHPTIYGDPDGYKIQRRDLEKESRYVLLDGRDIEAFGQYDAVIKFSENDGEINVMVPRNKLGPSGIELSNTSLQRLEELCEFKSDAVEPETDTKHYFAVADTPNPQGGDMTENRKYTVQTLRDLTPRVFLTEAPSMDSVKPGYAFIYVTKAAKELLSSVPLEGGYRTTMDTIRLLLDGARGIPHRLGNQYTPSVTEIMNLIGRRVEMSGWVNIFETQESTLMSVEAEAAIVGTIDVEDGELALTIKHVSRERGASAGLEYYPIWDLCRIIYTPTMRN